VWGEPYDGSQALELTFEENSMREKIKSGKLGLERAQRIQEFARPAVLVQAIAIGAGR
jgi:hypothetical protein